MLDFISQTLRLSAVLGKSEARNEPYITYGEVSIGAFDNAMRQEHWRSFWLRRKPGQCDAEVVE